MQTILLLHPHQNVIATSTSKRYCYDCAIQINLVTGKIIKDLHNDEFLSDVFLYIGSIGKKLMIEKHICRLAVLLVTTAIENKNYVSKNNIGLACAAIYLACKIKNQSITDTILPVSKKILQRNTHLLQTKLTSSDISTLSKAMYEMMD